MKNMLFFVLLVFYVTGVAAQRTLVPDLAESKVHFVIKNFGFNTGGDLSGINGTIHFDNTNPAKSTMNVTVKVATIDTDNDKRDKHLRSDDYFDAQQFPLIRLESTAIAPTATSGTYNFIGKLSIKDVTKTINFTFTATPKNAGCLFEAAFDINRVDFHVGKESAALGEKVKVNLSVFAK